MIGSLMSPASALGTLVVVLFTSACAPDASSSIATGRRHDAATTELAGPDTIAATQATADATAHDIDVLADDTERAPETTPETTLVSETTDATTAVCARWNGDRVDLREGSWTGSVASCEVGDVLEPSRTNTLRLVNLYRWLAALPAVEHDADLDAAAQACSLIMAANQDLTHDVPTSWDCYNDAGAGAAGRSNISTAAAVFAIDMYMADFGNEQTLGHRRWILSNSLGPIGIGSATRYSCLEVIGGHGHAGHPWTAWPPEGIVPYGALVQSGWGGQASVDYTGWSVQSDTITLTAASATVTRDGEPAPVTTSPLLEGYGSSTAIKIMPDGWQTEPGHTYHVELHGLTKQIGYDVVVVDCD